MSIVRGAWLLTTSIAFTGIVTSGARVQGAQSDAPPDWTRWNFPSVADGYEAAKGEGVCSTVEASRAYAQADARSLLVWGLTNDPSQFSEPENPRRDQIIRALDSLFQDTRDYMVTERNGFRGYALVRVQTDRAKAAIARVPKNVRRPAAVWLGQATYTPSAANTFEIRGPGDSQTSFAFEFTAEPGGDMMYWYLNRIGIDNAGGTDARWAFDVSVNGTVIYSMSRRGFESGRPSTCWPGTFGVMFGDNGDERKTYSGFSMGATPKRASYLVRVEGFRLD